MIRFATAIFAILLLFSRADAGFLTGPIVNPANGHSYYLLTADNWTNSEAEAVNIGGHLATIDNEAEGTWIYSMFSRFGGIDRNLWIGLYDPDPVHNSSNRATRRTEFRWISGESVTYTNWSPVEPNNPLSSEPGSPELYVHLWNPTDIYAGRWNNYHDDPNLSGRPMNGIVEVLASVPEPSSFALAAIGGLGVLWRRREWSRM